MGVSKYVARNKVRWRVDTYVTLPDGTVRRLKRGRIPTREQAQAIEHKLRVKLLRVPNVRRVVLDEEAFQRLSAKAEAWLRPILLVAFDTGMRKSEVLKLRWSQIDLKAGAVRLEAEDTKTDEPRVVYLT